MEVLNPIASFHVSLGAEELPQDRGDDNRGLQVLCGPKVELARVTIQVPLARPL